MDLGLQDKIFVVGGGSKGLGRGVADALVAEGARVLLLSRNQESLDRAVAEPRATGKRSTWLLVAVGVAVFLISIAGLALAIGLAWLLVRAVAG